MTTRRHVFSIGLVLLGMLPALLTAPASGRSLPPLIARTFPKGLPAGTTVVNAHRISFAQGAAFADLAPTRASCPSNAVCLFADANYGGRLVGFSACDTNGDGVCDWVNLILFAFNDQMSSWKNTKSVDAKWSFNAGGGGTQRCMNSNSQNPQLSAANNDKASAVIIYTSPTVC